MSGSAYSYLDLTVLDGVREHLVSGSAAILFTGGLSDIVWCNAQGVSLLGADNVRHAIEGDIHINPAMRRQLSSAVSKLRSSDGPVKALVRLQRRFTSELVGISLKTFILPDGEDGVLLLSDTIDAQAADPDEQARQLVDNLDGKGHCCALLGDEGAILVSSASFAEFDLEPDVLRDLCVTVAHDDSRLVKRVVATAKGPVPAGIARISDAPARSLLIVAGTDEDADDEAEGTFLPETRNAAGTAKPAPSLSSWYYNPSAPIMTMGKAALEPASDADDKVTDETGHSFAKPALVAGVVATGAVVAAAVGASLKGLKSDGDATPDDGEDVQKGQDGAINVAPASSPETDAWSDKANALPVSTDTQQTTDVASLYSVDEQGIDAGPFDGPVDNAIVPPDGLRVAAAENAGEFAEPEGAVDLNIPTDAAPVDGVSESSEGANNLAELSRAEDTGASGGDETAAEQAPGAGVSPVDIPDPLDGPVDGAIVPPTDLMVAGAENAGEPEEPDTPVDLSVAVDAPPPFTDAVDDTETADTEPETPRSPENPGIAAVPDMPHVPDVPAPAALHGRHGKSSHGTKPTERRLERRVEVMEPLDLDDTLFEEPRFSFQPTHKAQRFKWTIDADKRIGTVGPELTTALGTDPDALVGQPWSDVADALGLGGAMQIDALLDSHDTWSERTVMWPSADGSVTVPVDFSGLPTFDSTRTFTGYSGFGIIRMADAVEPGDADAGSAVETVADPTDDAPEQSTAAQTAIAEESARTLSDRDQKVFVEIGNQLTETPTGTDALDNGGETQGKGENDSASEAIVPVALVAGAVGLALTSSSDEEGSDEQGSADGGAADGSGMSDRGVGDAEPENGGDIEASTDTDGLEEPTGVEPTDHATPDNVVADEPDEFDDRIKSDPEAVEAAPTPPETEAEVDEQRGADVFGDGAQKAAAEGLDASAGLDPTGLQTEPVGASFVSISEIVDNAATEPLDANEPIETDVADAASNLVETDVEPHSERPSQNDEDQTVDFMAGSDSENVAVDAMRAGDLEDGASVVSSINADLVSEDDHEGHIRPVVDPAMLADDSADDARIGLTDDNASVGNETAGLVNHGTSEPSELSEQDASAKPAVPDHNVDTSILARLPIPLLVYRDLELLFANADFYNLTGYESLNDFADAGGVERLFGAYDDAHRDGPGAPIYHRNGDLLDVQAHLQHVPWDSARAMLLTLRPGNGPDGRRDMPEPDLPNDAGNIVSFTQPYDGGRSETRDSFGGVGVNDLRAVLDTASDGILFLSAKGTINGASRSAEALLDRPSAELEGESLSAYLAPESRDKFADYLLGISGGGVERLLNDGREFMLRTPDGGLIPVFMTIGRLGDSDKLCAVMRDVTAWRRTEEELLQAKHEAETASEQKTGFLARVSHEIRTPLNAIIGFSDLMLEERFGRIENDRYRGYLLDIHRSGSHVLDLVNDLLDISKIEAGKIELTFDACDLNLLVSNCVATMQAQANTHRIIIRSSLSAVVPKVLADQRSLKQIVLNLVSNSIKFTRSGGQVIVSTVYDQSGEVALRVRDTGIGMSDADLERAMEPFQQVETVPTRIPVRQNEQRGTGLGLPLTRAMALANKATFDIESELEEGTLVEIRFPANRVLQDI